MKSALLTTFLLIAVTLSFSQKIDTTYYDKNWKGVKFKELAQYIRFDFDFKDPMYDNKCRIFYQGGQVECEGVPLSKDKYDGTKSTWKGELTRFYQSGAKKSTGTYDNAGMANGLFSTWDEKGNLMSEEHFMNGKLQGQSVVFDKDDPQICYVTQFDQGIPVNNETMVFHSNGAAYRADFNTKRMIVSTPRQDDCKNVFKDGIATWFYEMNGIYISLNFMKANSYGKYYQCFLKLSNKTNQPIDVNPDKITGHYIKGEKTKEIELMPADEYLKKVARSMAWAQALDALSSNMNNANAGYSTSTTTGSAVGAGGWAMGSSTTTTYNPYERRAIMNEEQQRLNNNAAINQKYIENLDGAVLKRTTVDPGQQLVKSFLIKYLSADQLLVNIEINGVVYPFLMSKM
jgi:hypothetical protein